MKQLINKVFKIIKIYKFKETVGFIFTILYAVAAFGSPIVSKYLIDNVITTKSYQTLYTGLIIFFLVCISQPVFGYLKDIVFLNVTEKITYDIRDKLFHKIIYAPLKFFDKNKKGDILSRVLNDGRSASNFITDFFVVFFKNIIQILMILAGMIYLSVQLTFCVMLLFCIFFVLNLFLSKKFNVLVLQQQKNYDSICSDITQMTESITSIKSFTLENRIRAKFQKTLYRTYTANKKVQSLDILIRNLANILVVISLCIIYGAGALLTMKGIITLGTVIGMGLYFQYLVQPVYELIDNSNSMQKSVPIFDRLDEYFNMETENESADKPACAKLISDIKVRDLFFRYSGNKDLALNDITVTIPQEGMTALVGKSGSGKSTFVKLLLKFYSPTKGSIMWGNRNINDISTDEIRMNIGFVPQEIELFNESVLENLKCGSSASFESVVDICKKLNLHDKITSLPNGYDNIISERVNLSGGEKQRIAIARAILKHPAVYIFDEPTSALDQDNEYTVKNIMRELAKNNMVIVIAHKISTIVDSDNILLFDKGRIIDIGTHDILLASNPAYRDLVTNEKTALAVKN